MVFTTEQQEQDVLTLSARQHMAKKVILTEAFSYSAEDQNEFIGGMPVDMNGNGKCAILASGPLYATVQNNGHADQLSALLEQVVRQGQNGSGKVPAPPSAAAETGESGFDDLFLFANISKQFRSLRFKQPVLGKLMHRMFSAMNVDAAFLQLPKTPQYDLLEIRSGFLGNNGHAQGRREALERLIAAGVANCSGNYCVVNDSRRESAFEKLSDQPYRFMAVAVRHLKECYGWLGVVSYQMDTEYRPEELNILQTLANQLAAMLANMEQHDDLERFTINMVCSLVNAIEAKDAYTQGHSKRMHQYVMKMARKLKLPSQEREALKWAAVLHDIGKIGIPERILRKPGKLTDKEFELIREHPVKGEKILAPIKQLAPSMAAIKHHHERYDGTGYPDGLHGKEIPLTARILAIADTFDAITSKRSYRASKTKAEALVILDKVAGTQLDPYLVEVFVNIINEG